MNFISRKEAKDQGLKRYFTGIPCVNGHTQDRQVSDGKCRECNRLRCARRYKDKPEIYQVEHAKWREGNQETKRAGAARHYSKNSEAIKARSLEWAAANPEIKRATSARYRAENAEKIKENKARYHKENPIPIFIRNTLKRMLDDYSGGRSKYESLLGYTCEELKVHIERQFFMGMSWDRRSEFHIDHIIPMSHFLKQGVTDPKVINCLSNLQPIWAKDNLRKGAKVLALC